MDENSNNKSAIFAVDIGTTNLKCSLYDHELEIIDSNCVKV